MSIYPYCQNYVPNEPLCAKSVTTPDLSVCDLNKVILYSLPNFKPDVPSLLEVLPNGDSEWVSASSIIPNPDAIINSNPLIIPDSGQLLIADGDNAFNTQFTNLIDVSNSETCVNIRSGLFLYNTPTNPIRSLITTNEDDGLDLVNMNIGATITFATHEYTRSLKEIVEELITLRAEMNNVKELLKNLTDITI
jgi:hypothetical protein